MSEVTFRLARLGEDQAIIDFINANFDMRLPLINRPELYHHYYAGRGGVPQFAVAEDDGEYVSAAGYILANTNRRPDVWVSVWVAVKGRNGVGLELMNALPDLLHANVLACNNIRPNTCTFYQFLGWKAERLPHYYRLGRRKDYQLAKPLRYILPPVQRDLGLEKVEDAADLIPLGMPATPHTPVKDTGYLRRRYPRRSLAGSRFYRTVGGRRQRYPQLPDPAAVGKYRVLLLYQQAGKFCAVQGRWRPGPAQFKISAYLFITHFFPALSGWGFLFART